MTELKKNPADRLPYPIDWSSWLDAGELITDSQWSASPSGDLVLEDSSIGSGIGTQVWIQGGVDGTSYVVSNQITTDSSPVQKIKVKSFILIVKVPNAP